MSRSLSDLEDGVGIPGRRTACSKAQYSPELCLFLFSLKKPQKPILLKTRTTHICILPYVFSPCQLALFTDPNFSAFPYSGFSGQITPLKSHYKCIISVFCCCCHWLCPYFSANCNGAWKEKYKLLHN